MFVQIAFLSAIICYAAAFPFEYRFFIGDRDTVGGRQWLPLLADVNADETVLLEIRNDPKGRHGYNTSVSPLYRRLDEPYRKLYFPPEYQNTSQLRGHYAVDVLSYPELPGSSNVTRKAKFALALAHTGADPSEHFRFYNNYAGLLGMGRRVKPGHQAFKDHILGGKAAWCNGVDCVNSPNGLQTCGLVNFATNVVNRYTFHRHVNSSTFYTKATPSDQNPIGWSLPVDSYEFAYREYLAPFRITLSTTSDFLTLPDSVIKVITEGLGATKDEKTGYYTVPRADYTYSKPLVLIINDRAVPIPIWNMLATRGEGPFRLKIRGGGKEDEWFVGKPFTDSIAVCLDYVKNQAALYSVKIWGR